MDAAEKMNTATEQLKRSFFTDNWENVDQLRTGLSEMTVRLEECGQTKKERDALSKAVKRAGAVQYMFNIGNWKLDEKPCILVGNIPSALTSSEMMGHFGGLKGFTGILFKGEDTSLSKTVRILFDESSSAEAAAKDIDGSNWNGKELDAVVKKQI